MDAASLFTITMVSALLLALNPVSISIFVALLAGSLGKGHSKSQQHIVALTYLLSIFTLYGLGGVLVLNWLYILDMRTVMHISLIVGVLSITWGIVATKDFYWYTRRGESPKHLTSALHKLTVKNNDPVNAAKLAITAAYATLPSVGIPLIAYITIISILKPGEPAWVLLFAAIVMLPLFVIFALSLRGLKLSAVIKWKQDSKAIFRLCMGLVSIVFGWLLFLLVNGTLELFK